MTLNSENWKDYPYLVEWVDQMNAWADKYQIYEFISADDSGQDPTGRIRKSSDHEGALQVDEQLVWTLVDSVSEKYIVSGDFWHSDVRGWYIGKVPHLNNKLYLDFGKFACIKCQGESFIEDSEGEEVDCDQCEAGETSVWIELTDTDFRLAGK